MVGKNHEDLRQNGFTAVLLRLWRPLSSGSPGHMAALCRSIAFAAIVFGAFEAGAEDPKDILIVVNPSVNDTSVTPGQVREIFLKTRNVWPGSRSRVVAVNAKNGSDVRAAFRKRVLNMTGEEEQRFWQRQKLIGRKGQPPEFSNPLKAVFKLRHSVSYVFRSEYPQGIGRVILVIPAE